jgi:hypothetical protein
VKRFAFAITFVARIKRRILLWRVKRERMREGPPLDWRESGEVVLCVKCLHKNAADIKAMADSGELEQHDACYLLRRSEPELCDDCGRYDDAYAYRARA